MRVNKTICLSKVKPSIHPPYLNRRKNKSLQMYFITAKVEKNPNNILYFRTLNEIQKEKNMNKLQNIIKSDTINTLLNDKTGKN